MAAPGLALVAFMNRDLAIHFLSNECAPSNPDPAVLEAEWQSAVASLGPSIPNVGTPAISDIPSDKQGYVAQLVASPDWNEWFVANPTVEFRMVEAAPLLAFQFSIMDGAASTHGAQLGLAPSLDDLLATCLPLVHVPLPMDVALQASSALIRSRSLNVRPTFSMPQPGVFLLQVGSALPFVHVVRYNGRCYLYNGYHRAFAALQSGASEIPCIFREVTTEAELGLNPGTFDLALLESANPPAMHHYVSGHANPVDLVIKTRTIHLSLTDWIAPEI